MDALLHSYGTGQLNSTSGDIATLFYEAVILISILRPSSSHSRVPRSSWHMFLDDLSWLCDTQSGGKTVTSVGAEQISHAVRFWISANGRVKPKSLNYLEWILSELQKLACDPKLVAGDVEVQILDAAIRSSHERVGDYLRKLKIHVEKVANQGACVEEDVELLDDLHAILEKRGDFRDLCKSAYCLRYRPSYRSLKQKITQDPDPESWAYIRHYIGRLASWPGASKRVVEMAKTSPHLFEGYEVAFVGQNLKSSSWVPVQTEEFQNAMDNVRQSLHERLLDRGSMVTGLGAASAASIAVFLEKRRHHKFIPAVHAEI
ncbi:hypothetical protein LTR56_025147 [Elasticomyces elasticus]|nr:hypothetical protein LTR22_028091 [Elasticomyces elasticus]KAK3617635.1 hypothetical protein LTR56_025147 [Elasticomyces elasticus]